MTNTIKSCNQIAAITAAALMTMTTGAWAAETACGPTPNPPDIPEDGAALPDDLMEEALTAFEEYSEQFSTFNACAVAEYEEARIGIERAFDEFANKGKEGSE
ncbi:MAG TPA: hypothetical protein DGZ24_03885 [Rhodospirillaceae bacterium]|nr:hypothetical protein [Candidatus Neomarinimicrobiota bacterium]HCX14439.1 hypothetical protein [Rhodospirillaceae bacterium]